MRAYRSTFITLPCGIITTPCEGRKWADVIASASVGVCAHISVNEISFVGSARMKTHICVCMTRVSTSICLYCQVRINKDMCAQMSLCICGLYLGGDFFSSPRTRTRRPSCRSRWQAGGTSCTFACAGRECCGSSCSADRTHRGRA